jgi:hypothetical protein
METPAQSPPSETINIGKDVVTIGASQVTIDALHEMPDWQVREFARTPIYFRDNKYFLRQKSPAQKPFAARYVLEPWPADATWTSKSWLSYDEEAVAERDAAIKSGHMEDVVRAFLYLLFPFLGLLWSGTKDKLVRFGFVPRTITGVSIMLTFGVILLDGVFAKMLLLGSIKSGTVAVGAIIRSFYGHDYLVLGPLSIPVVWLDVALFVFLVLDLIIRYSQHLREVDSPWGFLEWLTCLVRPKKAKAVVIDAAAPAGPPVVQTAPGNEPDSRREAA